MKYHFNVYLRNTDNNIAGSKAVMDCEKTLIANGFNNKTFFFNKDNPIKMGFSILKLFFGILFWIISIPKKSIIIVQYPAIGISNFLNFYVSILKWRDCFVSCIIHDLYSLRKSGNFLSVNMEIDRLNRYNGVIAHNERMIGWLKENGLSTKAFPLEIFDYLFEMDNNYERIEEFYEKDNSIAFAGNLNKSGFLKDLITVEKLNFNLYGPLFNNKFVLESTNLKWFGSVNAELLVSKLEGLFGLIWDGGSIHNLDNNLGNYLKFINPHKASLYLAAGLPLIVPKDSALYDFVLENKIGLIVEDLEELPLKFTELKIESYKSMVENANLIGQKLKAGYYLSQTIPWIESLSAFED